MSHQLVATLCAKGTLVTPRLIRVFETIPRQEFVPEDLRHLAEEDMALPIGFGQTISQPSTVALMLELLEPREGENVLDVGSGSGWTSALLGAIVGAQGRVIALERLPELCEMTRVNVGKFGLIREGVVECYCHSGGKGYPARAPYDRILVSAQGTRIPRVLKDELREGGRLVMPVNQRLVVLEKRSAGEWREEEYPGFVFVPFIEES